MNWIGHIRRKDDTRKADHMFSSLTGGVRRRRRPRSRWWEFVWTDIKTGRSTNWREICRNSEEWKNVAEDAEVHLGFEVN